MAERDKEHTIPDPIDGLEGLSAGVSPENLQFLRGLIESFNTSTARLQDAYNGLREKVDSLNLQLEEKNRDLTASLAEQERLSSYLTSILESLSSGVLVIDADGIVTLFNRGAESITGVPVDNALGRSYRNVMGFDIPDELTPLWTLASGKTRTQMEKTIVSKNGSATPVGCSISPLINASGEMVGAVEIFMDLTRIKSLEDELARKEKLAALGQMAATMAHKIRNPLGGIAGFAGLLDLELRGDDNGRRLVRKITEGVDKLERIVTSLLSYTSPLRLGSHTVDLVELTGGIAVSTAADRGDVAITVDDPEGPVMAVIDAEQYRRAITNIVRNSLDAIEDSGAVTVTVCTDLSTLAPVSTAAERVIRAMMASSGGIRTIALSACVMIADTGAGMDAVSMGQLFVPFYTTRENGIGLGLAHAKRIIEEHGGSIFVESVEGEGTAVGIVLPRNRR